VVRERYNKVKVSYEVHNKYSQEQMQFHLGKLTVRKKTSLLEQIFVFGRLIIFRKNHFYLKVTRYVTIETIGS